MTCACGGYFVPQENGDVQFWHSDSCKAFSPELAQSAEAADLKSAQSGFKSQVRDQPYTLDKAYKERALMKQYLQMKVDVEDWHGVQDAASDLRDIDSWINGYLTNK